MNKVITNITAKARLASVRTATPAQDGQGLRR
jgi:hypothetical protein